MRECCREVGEALGGLAQSACKLGRVQDMRWHEHGKAEGGGHRSAQVQRREQYTAGIWGVDLLQQLATLAARLPIDFVYGKLARKVANTNHLTAEC